MLKDVFCFTLACYLLSLRWYIVYNGSDLIQNIQVIDDYYYTSRLFHYCSYEIFFFSVVCFKNCSKRNDSLVCGGTRDNENRWYRNICFLRKENCPFQYTKFLKKPDSECGSNGEKILALTSCNHDMCQSY